MTLRLRCRSRTSTLPSVTLVSVPSQRSVVTHFVPRTVATLSRPWVRKRECLSLPHRRRTTRRLPPDSWATTETPARVPQRSKPPPRRWRSVMPLLLRPWRIWKTPPQNVPFCVRPWALRALCRTILPRAGVDQRADRQVGAGRRARCSVAGAGGLDADRAAQRADDDGLAEHRRGDRGVAAGSGAGGAPSSVRCVSAACSRCRGRVVGHLDLGDLGVEVAELAGLVGPQLERRRRRPRPRRWWRRRGRGSASSGSSVELDDLGHGLGAGARGHRDVVGLLRRSCCRGRTRRGRSCPASSP